MSHTSVSVHANSQSTRLPRKGTPGRSAACHGGSYVFRRRAQGCRMLSDLLVATDSDEVVEASRTHHIPAVLTPLSIVQDGPASVGGPREARVADGCTSEHPGRRAARDHRTHRGAGAAIPPEPSRSRSPPPRDPGHARRGCRAAPRAEGAVTRLMLAAMLSLLPATPHSASIATEDERRRCTGSLRGHRLRLLGGPSSTPSTPFPPSLGAAENLEQLRLLGARVHTDPRPARRATPPSA